LADADVLRFTRVAAASWARLNAQDGEVGVRSSPTGARRAAAIAEDHLDFARAMNHVAVVRTIRPR